MNYGKNYVLSLLRAESIEKRNAKRSSIKCESVQSNKNESEGDWVFTARDQAWSEAPTYTLKNPVRLASVNIEELPFIDVMTPNVLDDVVGEDGQFVLYKADDDQYGFQADFGEDFDTMIYAYCAVDELKDVLHQVQQYIDGIPTDIDSDVDKFLDLVNGKANEEDMDVSAMGSLDDANEDADESWRTEWKKGTGHDFGYDHNAPLLFKQTPDGKVSITLGKNPYDGEEGYIGEVDYEIDDEEDSIVEQDNTIEEVLNKLSDYEAVTTYFDLNMPSQDLLDYIESFNEEDLSMNDEPIDTQEVPIDEVPVNEASKEYTFVIPCEVTVTVTADSADLAREILMRSTEIEVAEDVVEFANGDARLRAVDFSGTNIDSLDATNEFDYE